MARNVPEKPGLEGLEEKWSAYWRDQGTYRFDRTKTRDEIFSIDTPPPTVSGALHIGHCFSYTHTDLIARFQRMRGKEVFYPMGWDDNGLNTERRVQLMLGIACDPSLPYDPDFTPPEKAPEKAIPVSRPNFVEQCAAVTEQMEEKYFQLWSALGLSVDWDYNYTTIGERARRTSQRAFLRLLSKGLAYGTEAPTMWEVDLKSAIAQAEIVDKEVEGAYHRVAFPFADGEGAVWVDTTRPELIPADVAMVAHPDDERYQPLFGRQVLTPLFGTPLTIHPHELADPEKGTGIVMVSTFGDVTDVQWWRDIGDLPVRNVLSQDGRLRPITWGEPQWESRDVAAAQQAYDEMAGKAPKAARARIVELLNERGLMEGEARPITHPVKFWENGTKPLEILTQRQWFIRTLDFTEEFLQRGKELEWHPDYMRVRYEDWVKGLNSDWNISRQRYFGVPFPVWYPVDDNGQPLLDAPIVPVEDRLPIDPSSDVPDGYSPEQRGKPGGFIGDPDVMDTWATSSLTPQIIGGWEDDKDLFERVFPMDVRPQAHDIIRTWLFYTAVRAHFENGSLPFRHAVISGFIIDPDRKKISKSKGNAPDDPENLLAKHGADAIRYWAAGGRPGTDSILDKEGNQFKIGRRLAIKLLNASRFVLGFPENQGYVMKGDVTEPIDRSMLLHLSGVVDEATAGFDAYDYTRALERTESFFWSFCDDYLELVKARAYGGGSPEATASANAALTTALSVLLRLFAPFVPFVTEEVWSWWKDGSVHRQQWPVSDELRALAGDADPAVLTDAAGVLGEVRRTKSENKVSMRAPLSEIRITESDDAIVRLRSAESDLREATAAEVISFDSGTRQVTVTLANS